MISEVYVDGKRFTLDPALSLGKGGEADVYDLGGRALKVFKSPDHPDYQGLAAEQTAAEERLSRHQRKLREFPAGLPVEVVAPQSLATDRSGKVVRGYVMELVAGAEPLLRYGEGTYRRASAPSAVVVDLFRELWRAVRGIHAAGVVVGDFNDLNVLVTKDHHPRLIDSDSFQFGAFPCGVFTERFVDPRLCDPAAKSPRMVKPYDVEADWYAFTALLMQSLLFVGPYGGVYRPKGTPWSGPAASLPRVLHGERPLRRITVFHEDVHYPKPANDYRALPDALLQHFHAVFERDERGTFPVRLLDDLVFTRCAVCGLEHARARCPACARGAALAAGAPAPAPVIRGACRAARVFTTRGLIVFASMVGDRLCVLYHEDGAYRREDTLPILEGPLEPDLRARFFGDLTLLGRGVELAVLPIGSDARRFSVDTDGGGPAFDTNARHLYWAVGGRLLRDAPSPLSPLSPREPRGQEVIGEVLTNQTRIWVGPAFGLGLYRAGGLTRAFVFDAERRGINDELRLPPLRGKLIEATCYLDEGRAWLLVALQNAGRIEHLCFAYSRMGTLEASARATRGDGSWLGTLRGKCATHGVLLAATDAGIVRVEVCAGAIQTTRRFDETEPFVDGDSGLFVGPRGLYVVGLREIHALQLK